MAALGYTQQLPTEDRYLVTRAELLARLDVMLGGRVAEELVFGDMSTGGQDGRGRRMSTVAGADGARRVNVRSDGALRHSDTVSHHRQRGRTTPLSTLMR